jgi:hypothetical protein
MITYDGGPAFPVPEVFDERRGEVTQYGSAGMSLRDYFAAKAMQAALTGATLPGLLEGDPDALSAVDKLAAAAYLIADAMVAAR